jgi:hypothetical protein
MKLCAFTSKQSTPLKLFNPVLNRTREITSCPEDTIKDVIDYPIYYRGTATGGTEYKLTDATQTFSSDMIGKCVEIFIPPSLVKDKKSEGPLPLCSYAQRTITGLDDGGTSIVWSEPLPNMVNGVSYIVRPLSTTQEQYGLIYVTDAEYENLNDTLGASNPLAVIADIHDELLDNSPGFIQ